MARILGVLGMMALSLASGGCSFLFADGPPDRHEKMLYFDCTSTPGLEVADGVFGARDRADRRHRARHERERVRRRKTTAAIGTAFAAVNLVLAGVFVGSAIYGIVVTENCKDAKDRSPAAHHRTRNETSSCRGSACPLRPPWLRLPPCRRPPSQLRRPPAGETAPLPPPPAPAAPRPRPRAPPPHRAPPKPGTGSF